MFTHTCCWQMCFVFAQVGAAEVGTAGTRATGERKTRARAAGKRETGERKTSGFRSGNTWAGQQNGSFTWHCAREMTHSVMKWNTPMDSTFFSQDILSSFELWTKCFSTFLPSAVDFCVGGVTFSKPHDSAAASHTLMVLMVFVRYLFIF